MVTESQSACRPEMTSETRPVGAHATGPLSVKVTGTDLVTEPPTAAEFQSVSTVMTKPMAESQSATEPQAVMMAAEPQPVMLCAKPQVKSQLVDVSDVSCRAAVRVSGDS